jgi:adenylate cyclase
MPLMETAPGGIAFCDLAGFTAFTAERGDEAAVDLVERFEELTSESLPEGARIVKQLGDGLLLFFMEPSTSVPAVVELSRRCGVESSVSAPLWVRSGVHVGAPRVRGDDLIGHDVNVASRIADLAGPGEVLVSEAARQSCPNGEGLHYEEVGPVFVKGLNEPLRLYRVVEAEP